MRNIFQSYLLLLLLFISVHSYAQVRFGLKAGVNSSTKAGIASPPSSELVDPIPGWQLGLLADISISTKFSIQPSILFATKGNKLFSPIYVINNTNVNNDGVVRYAVRPHYIELPVLLLFKSTITNESVKLFGGFGPYVGVAVGGNVTTYFKGLTETNSLLIDKNPHYRRLDYGLSGSIGLELSHHWQIGVGYELGLVDVNGLNAVDFKSYNRSLSMSVGFFL